MTGCTPTKDRRKTDRNAEVPVMTTDACYAIFKCPKSIPVRAQIAVYVTSYFVLLLPNWFASKRAPLPYKICIQFRRLKSTCTQLHRQANMTVVTINRLKSLAIYNFNVCLPCWLRISNLQTYYKPCASAFALHKRLVCTSPHGSSL
eukprot:6201052-Pleurochrysis_carterae.AAC.3